MPRIPVYNSRASAPGPISGLGDELAAPGRALRRLGGAIVDFGESLAVREARHDAAGRLRAALEDDETTAGDLRDESVDPVGAAASERQEDPKSRAREAVSATLDAARDEARIAVLRADALNEASLDSDPERMPERALAYYDAAARTLIDGTADAGRRARLGALARDGRAVLIRRAEGRRDGHAAAILNRKLRSALAGYADAVRRDPAMLDAMLQRGVDVIAESVRLAGLGPEHAGAMTRGWSRQVHVALLEGTIERDPVLAVALLDGGLLDGPIGDKATVARLRSRADAAAAAAEATETQQARTRRRQFELSRQAHLGRIRRTGRGDPGTEAQVPALLDADGQTAFHDETADAEAEFAARSRYAFMTAEEIEADIADTAPGGGPADDGERARRHAARLAARDAILAERAGDPAGWAMQDGTVSEAFAAAEAAEEAAARPDSGPAGAEPADRAFRRALALRRQVQADMGETSRLLSVAERESLAAELQALSPTGRLARIGELRRRYGEYFDVLTEELSGRVDPDAGLLLANVEDAPLSGMLARGMEMQADGATRPAIAPVRVRPIPRTGEGKADLGALNSTHAYRLPAAIGEAVVRPRGNALVPVVDLSGSRQGQSFTETDRPIDAPYSGQVAPVPALIGEGSVGLPDERPIPGQDPSKVLTGADVLEKVKKGSALTQAVNLTDDELREYSQKNGDGVRALRDGGEILFSLGDGDEFLTLPVDAAAYVIRNWDSYRSRLALLRKLQDASLPPEELRRLVEDEVYKGIPVHLRNRMGGPGWIAIEGSDPDEYGQRAAAAKLKAYDDLVAALDAGASEETITELFENFQQAMFPELLGWGAVFSDIVKDLAPGLGNFRSGIFAWNDLIEIANDFNDGDLLGLIGNSGMLVLDSLGMIPAVNSAFAPVRIAVKSGGRRALRAAGRAPVARIVTRWQARYRLAKYLRTTTDSLKSRSIEEYFGKVWKDLPPRMQGVLRKRFQYFVGRSGEMHTASEAADAGFEVVNKFWRRKFDVKIDGKESRTRIFDFLTEQDFNTVWNDWFVIPGKSKSGRATGVEVKVNLSEYLKHQKDADENLVKNAEISASQVMRIPGDMIKPEHLAAAIDEWLKRPWRKEMKYIGGVRRRELEDLVKTLQRPGDLTVGQLFGLTLLYAVDRYAVPEEPTNGLMAEPAAMP